MPNVWNKSCAPTPPLFCLRMRGRLFGVDNSTQALVDPSAVGRTNLPAAGGRSTLSGNPGGRSPFTAHAAPLGDVITSAVTQPPDLAAALEEGVGVPVLKEGDEVRRAQR